MTDNLTKYLGKTGYHQGYAASLVARYAEDGNVAHLEQARDLLGSETEDISTMDALGDLSFRIATVINTVMNAQRSDALSTLDDLIASAGTKPTSKPKATKRKAEPKTEVKAEPKVEDEPAPKTEAKAEPAPEPEPEVETKPEPEPAPEPEVQTESKPESKVETNANSFGAKSIASQGF